VSPESEGRPDLVATDGDGVRRLVVEAKFDAALTSAQTSGAYVEKLTAGVPGALVFLVPQDRMRNLWHTVSVTPGGAIEPAVLSPDTVSLGVESMPLPGAGHVIAVLSWESLLNRIEAAMAKMGDTSGAAELTQIRGLVEWRTTTGWVPFAPEDLPQRVGRQLEGVANVLRSVAQQVAAAAGTKPRNGSGDGGFGRHITTASGKSIWIGIWFRWWDRYGPGPAWAQVKLKTPQQVALTADALTHVGVTDRHVRADRNEIVIPLHLPEGTERGAVEETVLKQVNIIISALDALPVEAIEDTDVEAPENPPENAPEP